MKPLTVYVVVDKKNRSVFFLGRPIIDHRKRVAEGAKKFLRDDINRLKVLKATLTFPTKKK